MNFKLILFFVINSLLPSVYCFGANVNQDINFVTKPSKTNLIAPDTSYRTSMLKTTLHAAKSIYDIFPEINKNNEEIISFEIYLSSRRCDPIVLTNKGSDLNEKVLDFLKIDRLYSVSFTYFQIKDNNGNPKPNQYSLEITLNLD